MSDEDFWPLRIYSISTGELFQNVDPGHWITSTTPWLTPDGSYVLCVATDGKATGWEVGESEVSEDCESEVSEVCESEVSEDCKAEVSEDCESEVSEDCENPLVGYPWESSRGYRVTNDWWILDWDRKRLLMLPPPWQSYPVRRVWKGKFLALLHGELSEPVILEMEP